MKFDEQTNEQLANGLGWFSIGLGLAEVLVPGGIAGLTGIRETDRTRSLLRYYGLREIVAGVGILTQPRPAGWVWGRVAGDLLDLASLASALTSSDANRARVASATAAVAGITALDIFCAQRLSRSEGAAGSNGSYKPRVIATAVVNRPPEEVYRFWRNLENLPRFMYYLESVETLRENQTRWTAKGPAGTTVSWTADITEDQPGRLIAWRSLEGADVHNSGVVSFEPNTGGRGTFVRVELEYAPPAGKLGATLAKLLGREPGQEITEDLRRFKQVMETGEVVNSDASIHRKPHAAHPPEAPAADLQPALQMFQ